MPPKKKNAKPPSKSSRSSDEITDIASPSAIAFRLRQISMKPSALERKSEVIENRSYTEEVVVEKEKSLNKEKAIEKPSKGRRRRSKVGIISFSSLSLIIVCKSLNKEKAIEKSSKNRRKRSKAACGLNNKPKPQIVDIDASDVNNDLAVVEYIEDLHNFYKSAENEGQARDYMGSQPEINDEMRATLIDFLVQAHDKFKLNPETLYLTVNIIDRYLASKTTSTTELRLVGLSAMLIASKYEDIFAPDVSELVSISDSTYSSEQILVMEKQILGQLEWRLTVPTLYVFLVRFIKASMTDSDVENMVYFLAELGMMNYSSTIMYSPSMIAASAVYAARCTVHVMPVWNETLKLHTGFLETQLMDCAKLLVQYHSMAAGNNMQAIYKKYSSSERGEVALLSPAKSLLAAAV